MFSCLDTLFEGYPARQAMKHIARNFGCWTHLSGTESVTLVTARKKDFEMNNTSEVNNIQASFN